MTQPLLIYDTRDDRREIVRMLSAMSPASRAAFVAWCCEKATVGARGVRPKDYGELERDARRCDRGDLRLTNTCYADLLHLIGHYPLKWNDVLPELRRRASKD